MLAKVTAARGLQDLEAAHVFAREHESVQPALT
jgi:hypothetical protein